MCQSQTRLLFKKDTEQDRLHPKIYRPIALLNVDFKILSCLLAAKLNHNLPFVISPDQHCGKDMQIGDLVHLISATMNYVNTPHPQDQKGFLLFLDFAKAFESVNHDTLTESMHFPPSFIRWVAWGRINTQARCIVNGKRSPFFDMPGGGRQGDNLFPLIFSIVVQGLHSLIATFPTSGILLPHSDKPEPIGKYADDTTLRGSTMADYDAYKSALAIFEQASGMVLNWNKSFILWLGSWQTLPPQLPQADQVQVVPPGDKLRVLC